MLSRTADHLFWMARYIERAENTARMLGVIEAARAHGIDVTTECYPYTAGATRIESILFDTWNDKAPEDYAKLQWAATGERLTRETFLERRKQGGLVLIHANTEEVIRTAVASPLTIIAAAMMRGRCSGSFSTMTAIAAANSTLVSRSAATSAIGATVIAQIAMP